MDTESKPLLIGGLGEINFGKQYRQGYILEITIGEK